MMNKKNEMLPSGRQLKYQNRIGWAFSHLTNVGAIQRVKMAHYQITDAGRQVLKDFPNGIKERDFDALGEDPNSAIRPYKAVPPRLKTINKSDEIEASSMTPIEQIQIGIDRIHNEVASTLLERLQSKEPAFFEQVVVDLLTAMGYSGTSGTAIVTPHSNDGGIDGIINQDVLGLDRVYIQAKRYAENNNVGRPELQAFVGALSGKASKGVFITTARFSDGAIEYSKNVPTRIILIDGKQLTQFMITYNVGVQVRETYKVVEIDGDFFE